MTVRLLTDWTDPDTGRKYLVGNLLTKDANTEAGLIAQNLADSNTTGGTAWTQAEDVQLRDVKLRVVDGNVTGLVGPDGEIIPFTPGSSIGTRIPVGIIGALTNQLGNTFSVGFRTAQAFDAVRIIYLNKCATQTVGMLCAASVADDLSSKHNSSGTWVTGTIADSTVRASADEPSFNYSSWIELDGSSKCGYVRLYVPSSGNTESSVAEFYANGNAGPAWAVMENDEWIMTKQAGDFVTAPASFNSTSIISFNGIAGIQYRSRGVVYNVSGVGDSIMHGTKGTTQADPFWVKAAHELKAAGMPIEISNHGVPGQTTDKYLARAKSLLLSDASPDVMIYGAFSPNDASGTPTAASTISQRNRLSELRDLAAQARCVLIPMTGMPKCTTNEATSVWTIAQNDLRQAVNTVVRALPVYLDLDAQIALSTATGVASGVRTGMLNADLLHLSEAGNVAAQAESVRAIKHGLMMPV